MICVIKNSKVFAIHSDNQVAEIRNKYSGLDIIHVADDTNVTLGGTDPRDSGATWKDARLLKGIVEIEDELLSHQADYTLQVPYAEATGTTNIYSVTLNPAPSSLVNGLAVAVKIPVDSTSTSTLNVNGLGAKTIKKANGTNVTNLKANGIYTLRYDGVNFILQGEGASGNATASDLLSGKTATTDAGEIAGTMTNCGAVSQSLAINGTYTIPAGYHNGSGKVTQSITTKGAQTYTPTTTNQVIAAGQYLSGAQTIKGDANLVPNNIVSGKSIFGVAGSFAGKKYASGSVISSSTTHQYKNINNAYYDRYYVTVTGLNFTPSMIRLSYSGEHACVYSNIPWTGYSFFCRIIMGNQNNAVESYNLDDYDYAYVTSNGFRLPVDFSNRAFTWEAWE